MKKYVIAKWTGQGFITHADKQIMDFQCFPMDINVVEGDESDIDSWKTRVGGVYSTQEDCQKLIDDQHYVDEEGNPIVIIIP